MYIRIGICNIVREMEGDQIEKVKCFDPWKRILIITLVLVAVEILLIVMIAIFFGGKKEEPETPFPFKYELDPSLNDYGVLNMYVTNTGADTPLNPCLPGDTLAGGNLNSGIPDSDHLWLCQEKGRAPTGIVDFKVVSSTNPFVQCPEGYMRHETNLNSGVQEISRWSYLCKKYGPPPYVEDVSVTISENGDFVRCPDGYWNLADTGINYGTSSRSFIEICGKKSYK